MGGPAVAEQKAEHGEGELRALLSAPAVGVPQHAPAAVRQSFMERRAAQREAYGQFVADAEIYWPGTSTLVFTTGQQVPMEHVEKWDLEANGMVHRVASPALARAGKRFSAKDGGQVVGGDGNPDVPADELPVTTTPPAPSVLPAEEDEGGTTESKRRASSASNKK
jgi:hypothetical protein